MRLFVALRLPAHVADHADRAVAPVRDQHPDLQWVPTPRWHVTLAFYGEIEDDRVDGVADMVERGLQGWKSLALRLVGSGCFDRRALWLGVDGEVDGLRSLARAVTFDRLPFRAHVTVARPRGGVDPGPAQSALAGYVGPGWVSGTVHLVRSTMGATPADSSGAALAYDDVATWQLADRS